MRHRVTLVGSRQVRNQKIKGKKLNSVPDESVVKIQQGENIIYAIYSSPIEQNNKQSETSQLSTRYMQLNHLQQGLASLQKVASPIKLKTIEIQLSSIDYELVNNNMHMLQMSFLDQINVLWRGAKIPLFFDEYNTIILSPKVDSICLVDPYAAINFTIQSNREEKCKQDKPNQKDKQKQNSQDSQQLQFGQRSMVLKNLNNRPSIQFGYDNIIYISYESFQLLRKIKKSQQIDSLLCTVESSTPFLYGPNFQQYLQYKKLQLANQIPQIKPILVQLRPYQSHQSLQNHSRQKGILLNQAFQQCQGYQSYQADKLAEVDTMQKQSHFTDQKRLRHNQQRQMLFSCSQLCRKSLSVPEKMTISQEMINSFNVTQTGSLEIFIKHLTQKKYRINIEILRPLSILSQNQIEQFKSKFTQNFIQTIREKGEFLFLQNYCPFIFRNQIYGLIIEKKTHNSQAFSPLKNFILVRNCSSYWIPSKKITASEQMINSIFEPIYKNIHISQPSSANLQNWLPIAKSLSYNSDCNINQENQQFSTIFELCFDKQLSQGFNFIKSQLCKERSSQMILFSTFSCNGKTYLHSYLNNHVQKSNKQLLVRSWYLDFRALAQPSNRFQDIQDYLQTFVSLSPYRVIFFDNIQTFMPNVEEGDQMRQKQKVISHVLSKFLINLLQINNKIGIFTSKNETNINKAIKFAKTIKLKNPNRQTRTHIIKYLKIQSSENLGQQLIDKTQSFSLGSFASYVMNRQIPIKNVLKKKNGFQKIVGLSEAKKIIKSVIQKPNKYGFIYDKVKIKVPRGILLYGATGNGKTALGTSVEEEFNMKFFTVKGSDILSKYIGGSQAAVRQVFQKALSVSPSIIFFDQFESIVPRRNSSGTGVTDRVVNQFLCYLDGVSSTTGVFIIAASSRPDLIDPALLRPGRIDSHIYAQYPSKQQRAELLQMFKNSVSINVPQQQIVEKTQNYSYSDMIGLLKELRIKQSSLLLKQRQEVRPQQFKQISEQLFLQTLALYRIGTELQEQNRQKQVFERFKYGKGPQIKQQKFIQM